MSGWFGRLAGLPLGPLLAALGVAAALTVGLYLLKPRRRVLQVPFAPLWQAALADTRATRLHRKLRHLWSLLLSLLAVLSLVYALGDPRFDAPVDEELEVVLVDVSPSMGADDGDPSRTGAKTTRLDAAKRWLNAHIDGLPPGRRLLVTAMGATPTPMTAQTTTPRLLRSAVAKLEVGAREAELDAALSFAADILSTRPNGHVTVLSDGQLNGAVREGQWAFPIDQVSFGSAEGNLAITALAARRHPLARTGSELMVEVLNAGPQPREAELVLSSGGRAVSTEQLSLAAGQRLQRRYGELTGIDEGIEAELRVPAGAEPVRSDDRGYAVLPPRRRTRVLAVTAGNLYLQAALLLDEYLAVDVVSPDAYRGAEDHDVVVFDDFVPASPSTRPALFLHPVPAAGSDYPFAVDGVVERPFFEQLKRRSDLLRHVALRDVNVGEAVRLKPQTGDEVVAGSSAVPLLIAGTRNGVPIVALSFDPRRSDLPLRAAWPLLLLNIVDHFQPPDVAYRAGLRVGRQALIPIEGADGARVLDPKGHAVASVLMAGRLRFTPAMPGFHTLVDAGGERLLAVNADDKLVHAIAPRAVARSVSKPGERHEAERTPGPASSLPRGTQPWMWIVLGVLLLLGVEWWTYQRRWTA